MTGGYDKTTDPKESKRVTRYSRSGDAETLPQLNHGRYYHACGFYLNKQGDNVRFIVNIYQSIRSLSCRCSSLLEESITMMTGPGWTAQKFWRPGGPGD